MIALIHFIRFLQQKNKRRRYFVEWLISVICHRCDPTRWRAYLLMLDVTNVMSRQASRLDNWIDIFRGTNKHVLLMFSVWAR